MTDANPIRVLLVDGTEAATAVTAALEADDRRFEVTTVGDATTALERLGQGYDCIVSAYELPGRDGIGLLEAVRTDRPDLPFVLYPEAGDEWVASEAVHAGVTDYLPRESDHAVLASRIADAVEGVHTRRQALFENAPGPVLAAEIRGDEVVVTDVNRAFTERFGYDREDIIGRAPTEVLVPESGTATYRRMLERTIAGEPVSTEVERLTADGPRTFLLQVIPYGGKPPDGVYAWFTDLSRSLERRQAIEALHATSRQLMEAESATAVAETTVEAVRDVLDMPVNTFYLYREDREQLEPVAWTDRAETLIGDLPSFGPGRGLAWETFETGEPQRYDDVSTAEGRLNQETPVRAELILPLEGHGVLLVGSEEPGAFDDTDVSLARILAAHAAAALDRIGREAELRTERSFIEQTLDTLTDLFFVLDTDGRLRRWNDRVLSVTGRTEAELEGLLATEAVPDDEEELLRDGFRQALSDGRATIEAHLLTADGEQIPHEFAIARLTDGDGEVTGAVGIGRDISDRRVRERELERQNERLEQLASVLSHDLRNPLNIARGYLELAREERDSEPLQQVADAHERMATLIEDLLTLARQGESVGETVPVDLGLAAEGSWRNVETGAARLVVEVERQIEADPGRLKQLLENLFRNSVEHGSTGHRTSSGDGVEHGSADSRHAANGGDSVERGSADDRPQNGATGDRDGTSVTVTVGGLDGGFYVADDGPGIPEDEREVVFEAGYSTTEDGTGFGLNIVREVAEAHGWTVTLTESEAGGARFEVTGVTET